MATDKWMRGLHLNKGAFTKKAQAAGMSTEAFADKVLGPRSQASTKTKRQANLAERFADAKHPKKKGQGIGKALRGGR